jgi:adenylate kinase
MTLNLIMLGPPGAGKGTQAERFARTRGIPKISTGDILREAVHDGSQIGRRAKAIMDRGELVGDDVMIGIVKERLDRADAARGFVLDGFPRTVAQAVALDEIMTGRDPLIVINIRVPEPELVRRLTSRLICEHCGANAALEDVATAAADEVMVPAGNGAAETVAIVRATAEPRRCRRCGGRLVQRSDDNQAIIRERLEVYHRETKPLVDYYHVRPTFRSINGAQPPDRVAAELAAAIEAVGNHRRPGAARLSDMTRGGRA